jgi:aminopeptidase
MSLEEFENFAYAAYFCDMENPADEWRKLGVMQQSKIDWLKGKNRVRIKSPRVDLELSIAGRTFLNDDGTGSISAGEIYTGPVEDSINGHIYFDFPALRQGHEIAGITLHFENGKVVKASAEKNEAALLAVLDTDAGARGVGEFAFGTNYRIKQYTGQLLFDEKMGGTIHLALGASYPETGGKNQSSIHWDIVCDLRTEGEITVDGELFFKNGQFVV